MFKRLTLTGVGVALALFALPQTASADEGYARSSGSLRAGPASNYPRVANVVRGESLEVYGCLRRYTWCDVSNGEDRGWFQGSRLGFTRDGRNLTLSNGSALLGLSILSFGLGDYWGSHYENRSWYNDRRWNRDRSRPTSGRPGDFQNDGSSQPRNPNGQPRPPRPYNPAQTDPQVAPTQRDQPFNGRGRPNPRTAPMDNQAPGTRQMPVQRDVAPKQAAPQQVAPQQRQPLQQQDQRQAPGPKQQPSRPANDGATKCQLPDGCP